MDLNSAFSTEEVVKGRYRQSSLFIDGMKIGTKKKNIHVKKDNDNDNENLSYDKASTNDKESKTKKIVPNNNHEQSSSIEKSDTNEEKQQSSYSSHSIDIDKQNADDFEISDDETAYQGEDQSLNQTEEETLPQSLIRDEEVSQTQWVGNPFPLPLFTDMPCRSDDIAFGISDLEIQPLPQPKLQSEIQYIDKQEPVFKEKEKIQPIPKITTNPEVEVDEIQYEVNHLKTERFASMSRREQKKYLRRKKKEERKQQKQEEKQKKHQKRKKQKGDKKYVVKEEYQSSEEENYYSDVKPQDDGKVDSKSSSPLGAITKNWKLTIIFLLPFIAGLIMLITGIGNLIG